MPVFSISLSRRFARSRELKGRLDCEATAHVVMEMQCHAMFVPRRVSLHPAFDLHFGLSRDRVNGLSQDFVLELCVVAKASEWSSLDSKQACL